MNKLRRCLLILTIAIGAESPARAHDTGFGHSRRTLFVAAEPGGFVLEYRIRQNPDEALIEMTLIDADHDGRVSIAERDTYFTARSARLAADMDVKTSAGTRLPIVFERCQLDASLIQTFRFRIATADAAVTLEDRAFPHKPGWVQIRSGRGVTVETVGPVDLTHADAVCLKVARSGL